MATISAGDIYLGSSFTVGSNTKNTFTITEQNFIQSAGPSPQNTNLIFYNNNSQFFTPRWNLANSSINISTVPGQISSIETRLKGVNATHLQESLNTADEYFWIQSSLHINPALDTQAIPTGIEGDPPAGLDFQLGSTHFDENETYDSSAGLSNDDPKDPLLRDLTFDTTPSSVDGDFAARRLTDWDGYLDGTDTYWLEIEARSTHGSTIVFGLEEIDLVINSTTPISANNTVGASANLSMSFDTEAYDTHIAHNDSRTVSTDYRLPIWGAFNSRIWETAYPAPTSDRKLGAFIIKNSYNTDSQVARFNTEPTTVDGDEKGAVRLCFDFLEIDPAATINSLTFKIVCKVATGTTDSFFIRTGDYETTQTYDTSSSATTVSNTKATYEITVDIDDTIKDSPDSGGYGIWAEIDPGDSIDLDVYHISAKLNYTGKTRSKTEAVIKPFAAGNSEITMPQWATKGYGFVDKIPLNSSIRNLRTQFGFFNGQVSRGYSVANLYYRQIRYDGTHLGVGNEKLYYHTESDLSFIDHQNVPGVDTSSIEIGTVDITLWNTLTLGSGVSGSGSSDFITMDPVETDTTDQSKLKTSDSNDILRRYPSAIEDTTPRSFASSTKRGWHIPEELVSWDYGNKVGLTYAQVTDTDFGVGNNQDGGLGGGGYSNNGYTGGVPWSKEYNTTTNTYRSTADHFDCADTNDRFCGAYTPDASLGHYTGNTLQGLSWIGGYAMVQVAYQEPLFVGFINVSSSFNFTIPADGVTVTNSGEADISPQITTTALGGFLLDDGASALNTAFTISDLQNTGLVFAGESDLDLAFSTVFEGDLATTGESDTAFDTTVTVSANNNIATTQTQSYSFNFDLENTGLAGRIRTGFTIDPTAQLDVADLAENGVFLLQQPPANFVYTTDSATRTITIPLQGEDRAHERHLVIDQQTRVIVIPLQGEDRAHERHLYIDQQTRTITAEALEE